MHELSIVSSVVDTVTDSLAAYPGARVLEVRLRVGALASVVVDSLEFCWGIATEDTPLQGSRLVVIAVPVVMHCAVCAADVELESVQSFRCPRCGQPCSDLRQGRELDIDSFEIDDETEPESSKSEKTGAKA
jgi:hydrogenase nickel incorporation protein HypA/HybF